jgi:ABC-2 type transport system permease protein
MFIPWMIALFFAGSEGYNLLSGIGQEGVVIGLICSISGIVTFVFGVSIIISVFYYSNDLEYILPLPFTSTQIVAAKFTVTLLYEYLTTFILLVPILVGYGWASEAGISYWILAVIAFLLIPVVPLIYGGIISMVIMMFQKKQKIEI